MLNVHFITAEGEKVAAQAEPGARLLEVAQNAGMPLEGTCEGQMACSTCHVIVAPEWFAKLPSASMEEEDMLDLAAGVARTSRLSCQIELTPDLDGIEVRIPGVSRDMQIG
ncbi:2Fe-2S ferredoxin [Novosphingobium malaysiense]|uniref:2Fe-2S ferredoxin n=1 Tax=Novosphingobium malaysiense TaxID=1348853 RepID=A0A0B1ZMC3_9SPHN|nr:2Fe-2S iron-sulfur cluster-binding protein [Novosphingobium malaysiense]KHK91686.1 2Fe-2S ferredoxin [Novosphingobium malaysiense]